MAAVLRQDGPWTLAIASHEAAAQAAQRSGDLLGQANALCNLGAVQRLAGDYPGATQALVTALGISRDIGDQLVNAESRRSARTRRGQSGIGGGLSMSSGLPVARALASNGGQDGVAEVVDWAAQARPDRTGWQASVSIACLSPRVGTPAYMSPEQCDGEQADRRSDLYSLGCVLYALLAGHPPLPAGKPLAVMACHRKAKPASVRALRPDVSADLDQFVLMLLAKEPAKRWPPDAACLAAMLKALTEPLASGQSATPAPSADLPARAAGGRNCAICSKARAGFMIWWGC